MDSGLKSTVWRMRIKQEVQYPVSYWYHACVPQMRGQSANNSLSDHTMSCTSCGMISPTVLTTHQPACTRDNWCDQKLMIDLEWPYWPICRIYFLVFHFLYTACSAWGREKWSRQTSLPLPPKLIRFHETLVHERSQHQRVHRGWRSTNFNPGEKISTPDSLLKLFHFKAFDDYITLHNLSMLLTYIVTLYHIMQWRNYSIGMW